MKIKCFKCLKVILEKERYMNLKTFNNEIEIENIFFHINCWKDHFNEKVKEKAINVVKQSVPQATNLVKQIVGENNALVKQIMGEDNATF